MNGQVQARDDNPPGQGTIEACQLNRDALRIYRKDMVLVYRKILWTQTERFLKYFSKHKVKPNLSYLEIAFFPWLEELRDMVRPSHEYAAFGRFLNEHFDKVFLEHLPEGETRIWIELAVEAFERQGTKVREEGSQA